MITIDNRAGSEELVPMFPPGVEVCSSRLDYGDCFFLGNGPDNSLVTVGIERKAIRDLVNSMVTGRLSGHQLPGMMQQYSYCYLLVEGVWRFDPDTGLLQVLTGSFWTDLCLGSRGFMAKEVVGFLNTLSIKAGIHLIYSGGKRETVQILCALYHWWNDKNWDSHTSHLSPNKAHKGTQGEIQLMKPSLVRRVAAELPLLGWGKSKAVDEYFSSVLQMANASVKEWKNIPGVGAGIAQKAYDEIRKENH